MSLDIFFSIITPNYNSAEFINLTYQSLVDQSHKKWEWLVVDDCSTDASLSLLQNIAKNDPRVKVFQTDVNSGAAAARNIALDHAAGEYLAFLDMDDLWHPEKLSIYSVRLASRSIDFGYSSYLKMGPDGVLGTEPIVPPSMVSYRDLLRTCSICTSTAVMRRGFVGAHRMRRDMRRGQDYIFWLDTLGKTGSAELLSSQPLTYYRVGNSSSLSNNKFRKAMDQWRIYRRVLGLNPIFAAYFFVHYAIHGALKFRKF